MLLRHMRTFFVQNQLYQFHIKDAIKAARNEATKAYHQYAEEPKTSQRRWGFDVELDYQRMDVRKRGAALAEQFPRCPAAVMGTKTRRRNTKNKSRVISRR